jgi:hypothetical protein
MEGMTPDVPASAWTDHLRLKQIIALGANGSGNHGGDEFRYEIVFDERSVALTVSYRKENDTQYRVQLEDKLGNRQTLGEGGLASTARQEGAHEIVEDKKMLSRADFDRIDTLVLQKQLVDGVVASAPNPRQTPGQASAPIASELATPTTVGPRGPFIARLAQGELELVGVSHHPSTNEPWWRPDGSPLETGFTAQALSINPNGRGYEVVFRNSGLSDDFSLRLQALSGAASISGMEQPLSLGEPAEHHDLYVIHVPPDRAGKDPRSLTLEVGIAAGEWTTLSRRSATAGESGAHTLKDGAVCRFLFGDPVETAGETRVTVSHNTLRDWDTRVSVVDLDGKEHLSRRHHTSVGELASTEGHFDGLRLVQAKEFRFEIRPCLWFEFREVALQPAVAREGTASFSR